MSFCTVRRAPLGWVQGKGHDASRAQRDPCRTLPHLSPQVPSSRFKWELLHLGTGALISAEATRRPMAEESGTSHVPGLRGSESCVEGKEGLVLTGTEACVLSSASLAVTKSSKNGDSRITEELLAGGPAVCLAPFPRTAGTKCDPWLPSKTPGGSRGIL